MSLITTILLLTQHVLCDNVGWRGYLTENPTDFHDIPLTWELEAAVPDWLSGTYVRNGPAQVSDVDYFIFRSSATACKELKNNF